MATTHIKPYTMTSFGELPDGTVFVDAYEYGHIQDELPLGLQWGEIYHRLASDNPDAREQAKIHHWGCSIRIPLFRRYDSDSPVISGPPLSQVDKIGPLLTPDEFKLLQYLLGCDGHESLRARLTPIVESGSRWTVSRTIQALERIDLVWTYSDFVQLSKRGILRALQDQQSVHL